jgi:hypothetical protein
MFTMVAQNTRKTISAAAAVAIVSFSGLVLDQAHLAAAPSGTIEVGELTPVGDTGMAIAALPEVVVVAKRHTAAGASFAATTQLPEIVVVAKRVAQRVAQSDSDGPSTKADAEGALLK